MAVPRRSFREDEHPRDSRGRFIAKPGGDEDPTGLRKHAELVASLYGDQLNTHRFVLTHGHTWPHDEGSFVGGTPHQCFMNATLAAWYDPELTYVEGFVSVHGVPIAHAWVVDRVGKVRDVTIGDPSGILGYFGVPFETDWLQQELLRSKYYGVLTGNARPKNLERVLRTGAAGVKRWP